MANAWKRSRAENEEMAARAYRLGARYSVVGEKLFRGSLTKTQNAKIAAACNVKRVSGQTPKNNDQLNSPQMLFHVSVFVFLLYSQPEEMPLEFRIIEAYEIYARIVATVDDEGNILNSVGAIIGTGGSERDHPYMPKLSFDRATLYATGNVFTASKMIESGYCGSCKTPMILSYEKRSQHYRCASCTDRLNAGRPRMNATPVIE